jgi:hypothetical protein
MRFSREVADRLAAWLKEGHTQIKCQWELETELLASTEGTYRLAAAETRAFPKFSTVAGIRWIFF